MTPSTLAPSSHNHRIRLGAAAFLLTVAGLLFLGCTAADRNGTLPPPVDLSQLTLNPTSVDFQFSPGSPPPAPLTIGLTGTLGEVSGLVVGTILYSPISSGWLAADLGTALDQTPNTLILTPRPPADLTSVT